MPNATMPANLPYWIPAYYTGSSPSEYNAALQPAEHSIGVYFPQTVDQMTRGQKAAFGSTMVPFDAQAQATVWAGLRTFEGIIDAKFFAASSLAVSPTTPPVISFIKAPLGADTVGSALPFEQGWFAGSVVISPNYAPPGSNGEGRLLAHELMHALGLDHPYEGINKIHPMDNGGFWTDISNTTTNTRPLPAGFHNQDGFAPRPLDIAALQYLYGPSKTTRTGNDVYKLVENDANFIWDGGGGTDTIDGQLLTKGMTIDLNPGTWGHIGAKADYITAAGQVTVNYGSVIENVVGTHHDDVIVGNDANNYFMGLSGNDTFKLGKGADTVDGGSGLDTVVLTGERGNYMATASNGNARLVSATAGTKDLTGVERVLFSQSADGIAYDTGNGAAAGDIIKTLAVLGGQALVSNKEIAGIGLFFRDIGMTRDQVSDAAVNAMVGPSGTNAQVVDLLWTNLMGSHPSAADSQVFVDMLNQGIYTRGSLTMAAADLMDQMVGLTGVPSYEFTVFAG